MNKNAWIPVGGSPTVLDFTKCKYDDEFHQVLRKAFGFPAYYGENSSAFWDLISGFFGDRRRESYWEVRIIGWNGMTERLGDDFSDYCAVIEHVEEVYPYVHFVWES